MVSRLFALFARNGILGMSGRSLKSELFDVVNVLSEMKFRGLFSICFPFILFVGIGVGVGVGVGIGVLGEATCFIDRSCLGDRILVGELAL